MFDKSTMLPTVMAAILLQAVSSWAQAPDTLWTKFYGEKSYFDNDQGYSIQETSGGGYIIAGYTDSYGDGQTDVYLIRTDADGDTLWMRTYGGSSWDEGYSVLQTIDDGYIVVGKTLSFGAGSYDAYVVRTDENGDTLWTRTYGGPGWDEARAVASAPGNGFMIVGVIESSGASGSDAFLIRIDSDGDTLWTKTFGGVEYDSFQSVDQTSDSGFVIAGFTGSEGAGDYDAYIVRTDADGDEIWSRTYGGAFIDKALSVRETTDGGCIAAGYSVSFGAGDGAAYLIRVDQGGDSLWTGLYGGSGSEIAYSVQQTPDGGFVFTGLTTSFGSNSQDLYIARTDAMGDTIWTRAYGGVNNDVGRSVLSTADNGYTIVGGGTPDGTNFDVWLLRMAPDCAGVEQESPGGFPVLRCYPNPFKDRVQVEYGLSTMANITLALYDVRGREIRNIADRCCGVGEYFEVWDGRDGFGQELPQGLYFLRIDAQGETATVKLMLVR